MVFPANLSAENPCYFESRFGGDFGCRCRHRQDPRVVAGDRLLVRHNEYRSKKLSKKPCDSKRSEPPKSRGHWLASAPMFL